MTHLASLTTNFSEHRGTEVLRCRIVPHQLKTSMASASSIEESCGFLIFWTLRWRVPHQLKSRAVFLIFLERYDGEFLVNWRRSKREIGVLRCSLIREKWNWRGIVERRNHTRKSPSLSLSPSTAERGGTWVLWCFAHRRQLKVSYRFDLEKEIASLFYIRNPCK